MAAITTRLTIDDFERLPQEQAENHELVDGELVEVSLNNLEHNSMRDLLIEIARPFVRERRLGTVVSEQGYDFAGNVHAPDISYFGVAKQSSAEPDKRVQRFVPDLAIEIVSPSNTVEDLWKKKDRYRRCGTAEVWIVVPATREVLVYTASGDRILHEDAELTTVLLPGFRLPVAKLFEGAA